VMAVRTPHPALRATFSLKGRREGCDPRAWRDIERLQL